MNKWIVIINSQSLTDRSFPLSINNCYLTLIGYKVHWRILLDLHFFDYHYIVYKHFYEKNTITAGFWSCYVSSIWSIYAIYSTEINIQLIPNLTSLRWLNICLHLWVIYITSTKNVKREKVLGLNKRKMFPLICLFYPKLLTRTP